MITKSSFTKTSLLLFTIFTILTISTCQQWYEKGNPHFITQPDYKKLVINPQTRNNGVTILKFFTPWCRYCKFLKDIIDQLKSQATWSITIYQVNCDQVNHHFCSSMGVHSFPKMAIFENGQFMQSMDGFYPYQVVREIFVKYNRTIAHAQPNHSQQHKNIHQIPKQQVKQPIKDQINYVQPQIIAVSKDNQHKNQPENSQLKHAVTVETENNKVEPVKIQEKIIPTQNTQHVQPKKQQQKHVEPVKVIQQKPIQTSLVNKQNNDKQNAQIHNQNVQKAVKIQTKSQLPKAKNNIKRTQQMIEQEQNIAIVDQNIKQTQDQKKIVQQVQKSTADTIDLTKFIPGQQHARKYGKYVIYAICIIVGFYYFIHIMKADPHNQQSKPRQRSNSSSQKVTKSQQLINKVSIQDSQMREELNFQHPNQQQVNFNSDQIRDQDL